MGVAISTATLDAVVRLGDLKAAGDASIDFYSFLRSGYYQTRRAQLREATSQPGVIRFTSHERTLTATQPGGHHTVVGPAEGQRLILTTAQEIVTFDPVPNKRPGKPKISSRTRFDSEIARAVSAGSPNNAPNTTNPPSRAPSAPGTMNAAVANAGAEAFQDKGVKHAEGWPRNRITTKFRRARGPPTRRNRLRAAKRLRYTATTASSIAEALPAKLDNHFSGTNPEPVWRTSQTYSDAGTARMQPPLQ